MLIDPPLKNYQFRTGLGLYNYSQKKWIYERVEMDAPSPSANVSWGKMHQGKVYHAADRSISCHNVMTGEAVWTISFPQGFGSSGFIIVDNKLIANCEDTYTYCLDPATGQQRWKEKSSGTCTPISYLNGIAYFSGGGDGKLHAIAPDTGKHLWKLNSPDLSVKSGAWFYGVCVAVPGKDGAKGRVVATTGINAYGYEAIR